MKSVHVGIDMSNGQDFTVVSYWKKPSRLRIFLRRIGLDKSRWLYRLVKEEKIKPRDLRGIKADQVIIDEYDLTLPEASHQE